MWDREGKMKETVARSLPTVLIDDYGRIESSHPATLNFVAERGGREMTGAGVSARRVLFKDEVAIECR